MKLQEYFNSQYNQSFKIVKIEGNKITEEIEGNELIIDNFDLEVICIENFPQLKSLVIKNCEKLKKLELSLNQNIEIKLIGDFPLLKYYKVNQQEKNPTIIYQEKIKGGFCWGRSCVTNAIGLISIMGLVTWISWLVKIIRKLKTELLLLKELIKKINGRIS